MSGIDLNQSIELVSAFYRFFKEKEHHISRTSLYDVLLLIYEGVLRFSEDGEQYEVHAGEYFIQPRGAVHNGEYVSDMPKYYCIHFFGKWENNETILHRRGTFDYEQCKPHIDRLAKAFSSKQPYTEKIARFYDLLIALRPKRSVDPTAKEIREYIKQNYLMPITIDMLCKEFHFSKNHIINLFKRSYNITPLAYVNSLRLQRAEQMIELSFDQLEQIAAKCGFQCYSNFYKLFHRKHGISPEKWREQQRDR